jgi:hypothetical protein
MAEYNARAGSSKERDNDAHEAYAAALEAAVRLFPSFLLSFHLPPSRRIDTAKRKLTACNTSTAPNLYLATVAAAPPPVNSMRRLSILSRLMKTSSSTLPPPNSSPFSPPPSLLSPYESASTTLRRSTSDAPTPTAPGSFRAFLNTEVCTS